MPLDQFISETLDALGTDADEILVEGAKSLRANPGPGEHALVNEFNQQMLRLFGARFQSTITRPRIRRASSRSGSSSATFRELG